MQTFVALLSRLFRTCFSWSFAFQNIFLWSIAEVPKSPGDLLFKTYFYGQLQKFPKIKQYEGVVCHGTEFPMMEETKMLPALFHRIMIDEICQVNFEMVTGEMFSIVSPPAVSYFG